MSDVQKYVLELSKSLDSNNVSYQEAKLFAGKINNYFRVNHAKLELEVSLDIFLNINYGVLSIIKKGVYIQKPAFTRIVNQLLLCLRHIVSSHSEFLQHSVSNILDTCLCVHTINKTLTTEISIKIILELINKIPYSSDIDVQKIIRFVFPKLTRRDDLTVLGCNYQLLGTLCEHFPQSSSELSNDFMNNITVELDNQMFLSSENKKYNVACFKRLQSAMINFPVNYETLKRIYKIIKSVFDSDKHPDVKIASLNLYEKHILCFVDLVINDYEWWHTRLINYPQFKKKNDCIIKTLLAFYNCIATVILKDNTGKNKEIFLYFMEYFNKNVYKLNPSLGDIKGFGAFAPVAKVLYSPDEYRSMFSLLLLHALQNYSLYSDNNTSPNYVAEFLSTLSLMMSPLLSVDDYLMPLIEKELVSAMCLYAKVNNGQDLASAIGLCFCCIPVPNHKSIKTVVYQSTIRHCSYRTPLYAEMQKQFGLENVITYENFIPLWKYLFNFSVDVVLLNKKLIGQQVHHIAESIYDNFISSVLEITQKLNFEIKRKASHSLGDSSQLNLNIDFGDEFEATNCADISLFANLVGLFEEVILSSELNTEWYQKWIPEINSTMIKYSSNAPLISGFYKLLTINFEAAVSIGYFKSYKDAKDICSTFNNVPGYIKKIIKLFVFYKGDLLISCLQVIISAPIQIIYPILFDAVPALQEVFHLGINCFKIAKAGLITLDRWTKFLGPKDMQLVFQELIPYLKPYLLIDDYSLQQNVQILEISGTESELKKISEDQTMIQQELFKILVNFDLNSCGNLLINDKNELLYENKSLVKVEVPFNDLKSFVYLDPIVPRLIELAQNSRDRKLRLNSCELLHLFIICTLGNSLQCRSNIFAPVIQETTTILLALATDYDITVSSLFKPLILQMSHLFATNLFNYSKMTSDFIEALMSGVMHPKDPSIRNLSSLCLQEFIVWSKNMQLEDKHKPSNLSVVLDLILKNLSHPSLTNRIGVVIAFKSISKELMMDSELIDKYSLSLLFHLVSSSLIYTEENSEITESIEYLSQILINNKDILNKASECRIVPQQFSGPLLYDGVCWLLKQCSSPNKYCRSISMSLMSKLSVALPGHTNLRSFFEEFSPFTLIEYNKNEGTLFPSKKLDHPEEVLFNSSTEELMTWMNSLLSSLHYYSWLLKDIQLPSKIITEPNCRILLGIEIFLKRISTHDFTSSLKYLKIDHTSYVHSGYELSFNETKIELAMSICEFFITLVLNSDNLPEALCEDYFIDFLSRAAVQPMCFGFFTHLQDSFKLFNNTAVKLLQRLKHVYTNLIWEKICDKTKIFGGDLMTDLFNNIPGIFRGSTKIDVHYEIIIHCAVALKNENLIEDIVPAWKKSSKDLLPIFVKSLYDDQNIMIILEPDVINLADHLLQFSCLAEPKGHSIVFGSILSSQELRSPFEKSSLTLGLHMLSLFEKTLVDVLLESTEFDIKPLFLNFSSQKLKIVIILLQHCHFVDTKYLNSNLKLLEEILSEWSNLTLWAGNNLMLNAELLNLVHHMANTNNPIKITGCFAKMSIALWMANVILLNGSLEVCLPYIKALHYIYGSNAFCQIIKTINDRYLEGFNCGSNLMESEKSTEMHSLWDNLLFCLKNTGDILLCAWLIKKSLLNLFDVQKIKETINSCINWISDTDKITMLDSIFQLNLEEIIDLEQKYKMSKHYTIPILSSTSQGTLIEFFKSHISEIKEILEEKFEESNICKTEDMVLCLLSKKIFCYMLVDIMFSSTGFNNSTNSGCPIIKELTGQINCKAFEKLFITLCYDARKIKAIFHTPTFLKWLRIMKCVSYNTLISILSNNQKSKETVYSLLLFSENHSKENIIWENLVDKNVNYEFPVVFDKPIEKKSFTTAICDTTTNILNSTTHLDFLSQLTLSQSTLTQDCNKFDFLNGVDPQTSDKLDPTHGKIKINLEVDHLNEHECMPSLCAIINHMMKEKSKDIEMPEWMKQLRKSVLNCNSIPVLSFLLKVIYNCQNIFLPYAKNWVTPILQCILNKACGENLNYFFKDIVSMLLSWHEVAKPETKPDKILVSNLLKVLLLKGPDNNKTIHKNNLKLIRSVIEVWNQAIDVPYLVILELLQDEHSKRKLMGFAAAGIFLGYNLIPYSSENKKRFLDDLIDVFYNPQKLPGSSQLVAEVIGLTFSKFEKNLQEHLHDHDFVLKVESKLNEFFKTKCINHFVTNIFEIQKHYPDITKKFSTCVLSILCDSHHKRLHSKCLKVLITCVEHEPMEDFRNKVIQSGLIEYINESDVKIQLSALNLAEKLITPYSSVVSPIVEKMINIYFMVNKEARAAIYHIFTMVYIDCSKRFYDKTYSIMNEKIKGPLISGLLDPETTVKEAAINFWTCNNNFPEKIVDIVLYVMSNMYSPNSEAYYLGLTIDLILNAAKKSRDGLAEIFNNPLPNHTYKEYNIITSLLSQNLSTAPLFVETFMPTVIQNLSMLKSVPANVSQTTSILDTTLQDSKRMPFLKQDIQLIRKYRTGDIPDFQIKNNELIESLQIIVKGDPVIARNLYISLINGITNTLKEKDRESLAKLKSSLTEVIVNIFSQTTSHNKFIISGLLQTLFDNDWEIPVDILTEVGKRSCLETVSSVLLENQISKCNHEPVTKRSKGYNEGDQWVKMIELYTNLNEDDIVRGIFLSKLPYPELIQRAYAEELIGNWSKSADIYRKLIEEDPSNCKKLYFSSLYKCMSNLSNWDGLNEELKKQVHGDFDNFWSDTWNINNLLPLYIKSEMQRFLCGDIECGKTLNKQMLNWMDKYPDIMKKKFGEELCILYLNNGMVSSCKKFSEDTITRQVSDWHHIYSLSKASYNKLLLNFKTMVEINVFSLLSGNMDKTSLIINQWGNDLPSPNDPFLLWDVRMSYREFMADFLRKKLIGISEDLLLKIDEVQLNMYSSLFDCAYAQNNYYVAHNIFIKVRDMVKKESSLFSGESHQYLAVKSSQIRFLIAKSKKDWKEKLCEIKTAWKFIEGCNEDRNFDLVCQHKSVLLKELCSILPKEINNLDNDDKAFLRNVISRKDITSESYGDIIQSLWRKGLEELNQSASMSDDKNFVGQSYIKIVRYCLQARNHCENIESFEDHLIPSLLRSMSYNTMEARHLFPILLNCESLQNKNINVFVNESAKIPDWMFLQWLPQILGCLDTILVSAIGPLLIRLAASHPNEIKIPFTMSKELFTFKHPGTLQIVNKLSLFLSKDSFIDEFIEAFHSICHPNVMLMNYVQEMLDNINNMNNIEKIYCEMLTKCFRHGSEDFMRGKLYIMNEKYKNDLLIGYEKLKTGDSSKLIDCKHKMNQGTEILKPGHFKLKDFCPWMDKFKNNSESITMPSKLTFDYNTEYNVNTVKITGFTDTVQVLHSLRHPIRVTMLGSNGLEYDWLVKFGEDLRQDQRIQQLLEIMNYSLRTKNNTILLNIATYIVYPFSSKLGIIKWIDDTKTLKELISVTLSPNEVKVWESLVKEHVLWIAKPSHMQKPQTGDLYSNAVLYYSEQDVVSKFRILSNCLPNDLIRKVLYKMCFTLEYYFKLKSEFLRSHSVICICHWLLGVGDRHLSNILVCTTSGQTIGVDFGHAFGTATQFLPVPELIPFRLTPQFLNLACPLKHDGLIRETMIRCLYSLDKQVILAAMQVFIQEPTLDWTQLSRKQAKLMGHSISDTNWFPKKRLLTAQKKLNNGNPVELMCDELLAGHKNNLAIEKYCSLVKGQRSILKELTIEQQVNCLISQATDENILGLTWSQFEPWL